MNCVKTNGDFICLETASTSYVIRVNGTYAEHVYYGAKIPAEDCASLVGRRTSLLVNTLYPEGDVTYAFDAKGFEISLPCRGDSRGASVCLNIDDRISDFAYTGMTRGGTPDSGAMPLPEGYDDAVCLRFEDLAHRGVVLECWYLVFRDTDVIARFRRLVNGGGKTVRVLRLDSQQTDMPADNKQLVTFCGAWGREMSPVVRDIGVGSISAGSFSGMSSAECNHFFMVRDSSATEDGGDVYAFNLMYSASGEMCAERDPYGTVRVTSGIQSRNLCYDVAPSSVFVTPCAVTVFSDKGMNGASRNMHRFVREHVVSATKIPVMLNTWEAVYFGLDENKILGLADKAAECGFECLVIDDGWFEGRNDDTTSLGDWYEDKSKFPHGLKELSRRLAEKGLATGLWIEPEMISPQSNLFREHPDWVLRTDGVRSVVGRGQYILDLTSDEVRDHVEASVIRLAEEYGASYVKWDFNRRFADIRASKGSGYFYDYVSGLYEVLKRIKRKHPELVIENCASGGGRFDLGMMKYTAFSWSSDNTDPVSRAGIQRGISYGYPLCVTLNHYASSPAHQTQRTSAPETRAETAFLGVFGVQADITAMSEEEIAVIKSAVAAYREKRDSVLSSDVYRLSVGEGEYKALQTVTRDGKGGFLFVARDRFRTVTDLPAVRLRGLSPDVKYRVTGDGVDVVASGATLMNAGLRFPQTYQGIPASEDTIVMTDGKTLLLEITATEERK